jgi:tetratricopeptide (TPR) repeat protein
LLLQEGVEWAQKNKMKIPEADLRLALYKLNPNANPASLFQIGLPYYQAKAYQKSDSVFKAYIAAFPDSVYGHYWSANSLAALDSNMSQGLAIPGYQKTMEIAATDKVRFKSMGIQASGYLATYFNNVKKDKATAITYLQKGLEFDPANANLQKTLNILQGNKSTGTSKPAASTSTSAKSTKDPAVNKKG